MEGRTPPDTLPGVSSWLPERGVLLYRPRLDGGRSRPLRRDEPPFPWVVVPLLGLGFALIFAGVALTGVDWRAWEGAVIAVGVTLVVLALGRLVGRFL